jgi:hypothetical protein
MFSLPQDNLLLYNHAKLMAEDNHSSGKEYLVSIMFSHYDQNNNGALEREELEQVCFVFRIDQWIHIKCVEVFTKVELCHISEACIMHGARTVMFASDIFLK